MATKQFQAVDMSTIYDVCLNTYGNLDLLVKLMVDNSHNGVNEYPTAGQIYKYDDTLVYGLAQQKNATIKYATGQ